MGGVNFLPFARRQDITVPGATTSPGRVSTRLTDLSAGGGLQAHINDVIIFQGTDTSAGNQFTGDGGDIRMRMAISGKNYLTENLYDYRVFQNGIRPQCTVWKWKRPYRLYPGEQLYVLEGDAPVSENEDYSILFSGVRVVDREPIMLHATEMLSEAPGNPVILSGPTLHCPHDTPIDLYSVSSHVWRVESGAGGFFSRSIQVFGPDDRPWWQGRTWQHVLDPPVAPIILDVDLDPTQTITFEFENHQTASDTLVVIVRGTIEVNDPRREG